MPNYIRCLAQANEYVKASQLGDFEFTDPREGLIFAGWVGAVLPIDEETYITLESELGALIGERWHPLLSSPAWKHERSLVSQRRFVKVVKLHEVYRWEGRVEFKMRLYRTEVRKLLEKGLNPIEFIFWEASEPMQSDERFWKYVAGCYFRSQGYLVTRWQPSGQEGNPDLCAIREPAIAEPLRKYRLIRGGCFTFELELPRIFGLVEPYPVKEQEAHTVVIEAEGRYPYPGIMQLLQRGNAFRPKPGYLEQGYYDEGYVTCPDFPRSDGRVGIISNKENGDLFVSACPKTYSKTKQKAQCIQEFEAFTKLLLLRNFTAREVSELFLSSASLSFYDYLLYIESEAHKLDLITLAEMASEKGR